MPGEARGSAQAVHPSTTVGLLCLMVTCGVEQAAYRCQTLTLTSQCPPTALKGTFWAPSRTLQMARCAAMSSAPLTTVGNSSG